MGDDPDTRLLMPGVSLGTLKRIGSQLQLEYLHVEVSLEEYQLREFFAMEEKP